MGTGLSGGRLAEFAEAAEFGIPAGAKLIRGAAREFIQLGHNRLLQGLGGFRRGAVVPLKQNVDEALTLQGPDGALLAKTIEKVVVVRRCWGCPRRPSATICT